MIVAIESASTDVSIALADEDGALRRVDGWSAGQRQSHELLPRITALLEADGSAVSAVTALAVGTGPGSFTGLRVGMSLAKGLAVALDLPIVGIPSLPAWLESEPNAAAAVTRAGAREAYLLPQRATQPQIVDRDALAGVDGPLVAPAELSEAFGLTDAIQPLRPPWRARPGCAWPTIGRATTSRGWSLPICARRVAWPRPPPVESEMAIVTPLTVDAMRTTDIEAVHEIERLSFITPWPTYAFEQELRGNRLARYVVARAGTNEGERVVGFAGLWLMVDEGHVTTFGVHPEWRRQGVGSRLMLRLVDIALELGAARMTLEVRVGNHPAQELYRRFGFTIAGTRVRYYTDDGEDAFVMSTPVLSEPAMRDIIDAERERLEGRIG